MIIDEIKKANMQALKDHDTVARAGLSVLINKYMLFDIEQRKDGKQTTDADTISLIQKAIKELEEEKEMYASNGREETAKESQHQIDALQKFLPQMMAEADVRKIIEGLADKSIRNIMVTFKTNYAGKVDMGMVSRVAKDYQGK
jgi:uncharacterized protein YqeY